MTKTNSARKREARAVAKQTGRSYTAVLRQHTASGLPGLAERLDAQAGYGDLGGTEEQWHQTMTLVAGSPGLALLAGLGLGSVYCPELGHRPVLVHTTGLADPDRPTRPLALVASLFGDPRRLITPWREITVAQGLPAGVLPSFHDTLAGPALRQPRLDRITEAFLGRPTAAVAFSAGQKHLPERISEGPLAHRLIQVPWPGPHNWDAATLERLVAQCFGHAVRALAERGPSIAVFRSEVQRIHRQLTAAGDGPVSEFAYNLAIGAAGAQVLARLSSLSALGEQAMAAAEELFVRRHKKLAGVQRLPHPAATPWERLTGMLAIIGGQRGLVLGPVEAATPAVLRLDREDGGGVVVVDAGAQEVDPLPFDVSVPDRGASSTRCPAGRPLYGYGHIPAMLATETMLRNMRRQGGQGQQPIATYLNHQRHGEAWVPLYAVADTVALPELTPGRAAAWQANRTCCECGAQRDRPIPKGPSGERACRDCVETVAERWWHQQRRLERADAQRWAAGVLADPAAVLVREERLATGVGLCAVTIGGQVLIDTTIRADLDQVWVYPREGKTEEQAKADFLATHTEPGDLGLFAAVHSLGGRRLVAWRRPHDGALLRGYEWTTGLTLGVDLAVAPGDDFTDRCTRWIGERAAAPHVRWVQNPQLQRYPTPTDAPAIEEVTRMRQLLERMARGADPAVS